MLRSQQETDPHGPYNIHEQERLALLRRHRAIVAILLIGSAFLLVIASFSANNLFPLFALIGVSATLPCLLLGIVLGISGILAGIISVLERLQGSGRVAYQPVAGMRTSHTKEHRYDRN